MMASILVPIAASHTEAGGAALAMAADIAKSQGGKITVLSVSETIPGSLIWDVSQPAIEKLREEEQKLIQQAIAAQAVASDVEIVFRSGHPARQILSYSRENKTDLIVIASHNPGVADYILGSVAARVVRHAHCSVLVVRNPER